MLTLRARNRHSRAKILRGVLGTALAVALIGSGFFCRPVQAATIQGTIDFGGVVSFNTMSLATAARVDVWNSSFVLQDTGDFATFVSPGASATMAAPWTFNSGTPATPMPGPATSMLWSVGGFQFDLTSSTVVSQSATFLNITGIGTLSGHSFDPTPGSWSFTSSRSDGSSNTSFSFQAESAPSAVPEANSTALCAIGLASLLILKLGRRNSKELRK